MVRQSFAAIAVLVCMFAAAPAADARQDVRLASTPSLSPDGKKLAFSWAGEIWVVSANGGRAMQLTTHPAFDYQPVFSPDGKQLAFTSDRTGSRQAYIMPATGGEPRQITFHSEGCAIADWYPDGTALLIQADRDHFWRHEERFFRVSIENRQAERPLFDAYGESGSLSPDGNRLLFTREGVEWWRQGYRGSRASQVWMVNLEDKSFKQVVTHESGCRYPVWKPDGSGFYYVGQQSGSFNLYDYNLETDESKQLTHFDSDAVLTPTVSRDGKTIVFRHLFDFYRLRPGQDKAPKKLNIFHDGDTPNGDVVRRVLKDAGDVAFTDDGLEMAFIAGGDLWVMDTELKEPKQVTDTPQEERDPVFAPDRSAVLYVSERDGQPDIWRTTREDDRRFWFLNTSFKHERLTNDAENESDLTWSPAGDVVAFIKGRGDLYLMKPDGKDARRLIESWDAPGYDWSPDGKWIVYSVYDNDFNSDVWIRPIDGSRDPVNVSRHPDNEYGPVWSPDGKMIAFTGRRVGEETDIHFLFLQKQEDETTQRDRQLKEAIEKLEKARPQNKPQPEAKPAPQAAKDGDDKPQDKAAEDAPKPEAGGEAEKKEEPAKKLPEVKIDFDRIHERLRRVAIADTQERSLIWSPDSTKLAFSATINGREGTYTIEPPDDLSAKLLVGATGSNARWLAKGNQIVWLSGNVPGSVSAKGEQKRFAFSALQEYDRAAKHEAAFDQCWRTMRDYWYDDSFNNRNWDAVYRKYAPMARYAPDTETLSRVVNMMLGELNGSHLGFYAGGDSHQDADQQWRPVTAHLGVRLDPTFNGPGWRVRDVIRDGPAGKTKADVKPGEVIISVDGRAVDPGMDVADVLNGPLQRDIVLRIKDKDGDERGVTIRPISYAQARSLLYDQWVQENREKVEEASGGKLGYLHIRSMNMPSFYQFEHDLYAAGAGKQGLVIDVRENGGGFTTDHLLTALTQPVHAITVPRGGGPGYPHDRRVYATWHKPIIVLCNQNSFSNAEIFSHAIKTLGRGELVGVTTAGGVISTGSRSILDIGRIRVPFRGWFVADTGQDMEMNGAVPHHAVWPAPGDWPSGKDTQLDKAIKVLGEKVKQWEQREKAELIRASERGE